MYRVKVLTDGIEYMLHDINSVNEQIYDDEFSEIIGRTETFNFTIDPNHPNIDKIKTFTSEIRIYQDNKIIFFGRSLTPQWDMYNVNIVECMGGMSYLADSMQAPFELTGSIENFIDQLLIVHNSQVGSDKQFKKGIVNVAAPSITRSSESYSSTLAVLHNYLDDYNGYLRARKVNGENYVDFVADYGGINNQVIRFGQNILDVQKGADAGELITCLIPEGDSVDETKADGTIESKTIDITSVNGGKNYIESDIGVAKWGRIFGYAKFEGITEPSELLQQATTYLENKILLPETIELTAIDLSNIDVTVDSFKMGYWTKCVSEPHNLSGTYLLKKMVRHLTAPQNDKITLGETKKTLTGTVANNAHSVNIKIDKVKKSNSKEIEQKVNNASKLITGGLGGYVVLDVSDPDTGEKTHPWRILIMDTPNKDTATSVIQLNKNGIGFSTTGIKGPYSNAWTIDGNLVADFITAGTMLADRIRGGMLEVGGSGIGKDGSIVVKNSNGDVIGKWNKSGLHITLGIIEGSIINGSTILGGTINVGAGTFVVNGDGSVSINTGEIHIGNVYINPNYTWLGAYGISSEEGGIFYSRDTEYSVMIATASNTVYWPGHPHIQLKKGDNHTNIGELGVWTTGEMECKDLTMTGNQNFWQGWSVEREIIYLHNKVFGTDY